MSTVEFILGFAGIVIGLGVTDLLTSLHRLLRAAARVRWDWLALSFAALMLFASVVFWWLSFDWYRASTSITVAEFLPMLVFLCLSFLMMAAALPDDAPAEGIDLREFYLGTRIHRWSLVSLSLFFNIALVFVDDLHVGFLTFASGMWPVVGSFVLAVAAACSKRIWVHVLAISWITAVTCYSSLFTAVAGA